MVAFTKLASGFALAATSVWAAEEMAHDEVQGYDEQVPEGVLGELYLKYKPWLKVNDACKPYPAVQEDGRVSGGLQKSGDKTGGCGDSEGQVYARGRSWDDGTFAIMYAWYFPKDQMSHGGGSAGHRHDWEDIIIWLDAKATDAEVLGVYASGHGDYKASGMDGYQVHWEDDRPKIAYGSLGSTHEVYFTTEKGGEQPLVGWENLSGAAQDSLNRHEWGEGDAICPFKSEHDGPFTGNGEDEEYKFEENLLSTKPGE